MILLARMDGGSGHMGERGAGDEMGAETHAYPNATQRHSDPPQLETACWHSLDGTPGAGLAPSALPIHAARLASNR